MILRGNITKSINPGAMLPELSPLPVGSCVIFSKVPRNSAPQCIIFLLAAVTITTNLVALKNTNSGGQKFGICFTGLNKIKVLIGLCSLHRL